MINPIKYLISNAKLAPEKPAIISTALTFSYKEINHKLMHEKLKYIYYKLFGEQIKFNTQSRKIKNH
jgi:hypothetical protein